MAHGPNADADRSLGTAAKKDAEAPSLHSPAEPYA